MKTLQQFKDALKAILDKQEKQDDLVNKCLLMQEVLQKARRVYGIGDKATWGGKTYVKGNDKKWRRVYDNIDGRGASMTLSHITRAIDNAKSNHELMEIVKKYKGRFSDADGKPLPIVQELWQSVRDKSAGLAKERSTKEPSGYEKYAKEQDERDRKIKQQAQKLAELLKRASQGSLPNKTIDNNKKKVNNISSFNPSDWENATDWKNTFEDEFANYWQDLYADEFADEVCGRPSSELDDDERKAMNEYTQNNYGINQCMLTNSREHGYAKNSAKILSVIGTRTRKDLILKRSISKDVLNKMFEEGVGVGKETKPRCFTSCTLGMDDDCNFWKDNAFNLYIQAPKGTPCFVPGEAGCEDYWGQREVVLMPHIRLQCVKIDGGDIFLRVL